jgi:phosphotransferase system enzyme I (PtsI)
VGERILHGIPVSPGVCRGRIVVLGKHSDAVPRYEVAASEVPGQLQRLEHALTETRKQILDVQRRVSAAMGAKDAGIFDAHLLVLEDPTLVGEVTRLIEEKRVNAEHAFEQVAEKYAATLSAMEDEYLRERASDMRDVASRVLGNLVGRSDASILPHLTEPCIIISHDLTPSTTAQLDKKLVLGFATEVGSRTSHTAILARSLRIPAIVGLQDSSQRLESGQYVLLDGYNGHLILNPTDQTLFEYGQLVRRQADLERKLDLVRDQPSVTLDGVPIALSANVEHADDADAVRAGGAEGVGLFRTEYLFINRDTMPTEEEQYQEYRKVAAALNPQPIIIRTLDLGGDKLLSSLQVPAEMNPFLGWRAIRFCLQERHVFRAQLRAILRASAAGNVRLMYPMISGLPELLRANELLDQCKADLRAEHQPFNEALEVGVMIEVPSAALIVDSLARRVKFLSLGTNDLIQYTLAVDRLNERVANLYEPTHPAILRLIKATADAAHTHGIWAGVCGEMAGDPAMVPLLLGLGITELSTAASLVPQIKFLIRRLKLEEARALAEFALNCESAAEILARSQALAQQVAPSLFEK